MKNSKTSNLLRVIAFFLTGVILVCTFGFTVDGWAQDNIDQPGYSPPTDDENTKVDNPPADVTPEQPELIFYNPLTGLETTEELASKAPLAYIMDKGAPCFGLSGAEIIIDIPTEEDNRLVCIRTQNDNLWKIGSIAPTRGYISNLCCYFGATVISHGKDDIIKYDSCNTDKLFDLQNIPSSYYSEYDNFIYSNSDLLDPIVSAPVSDMTLPYSFVSNDDKITYEVPLSRLVVENTELVFNIESGKYSWYENGEQKRDLINGKTIDFTNCLVLFADSTVYDNSDGCQMVMNTIGSGEGYYLTGGSVAKIKWTSSINGSMSLFNDKGDPLVINRGELYIRYVRASMMDKIILS